MPGWRPFHPEEAGVIAELVEQGVLTPPIDRTYPLEQVADALANVHEGRNRGKIVITI